MIERKIEIIYKIKYEVNQYLAQSIHQETMRLDRHEFLKGTG